MFPKGPHVLVPRTPAANDEPSIVIDFPPLRALDREFLGREKECPKDAKAVSQARKRQVKDAYIFPRREKCSHRTKKEGWQKARLGRDIVAG